MTRWGNGREHVGVRRMECGLTVGKLDRGSGPE